MRSKEVMTVFNSADIAIADGIGILWAERFLSLPLTFKSYFGKIIQAVWQIIYSGVGVLFNPKSIYQVLPEKITGADIIWDIARLASEKNYSIYLLGGFGDTPKLCAEVLQRNYPNLRIVGTSNNNPGQEQDIFNDLNNTNPDILLVAFGPVRQEQWIKQHYDQLPTKLVIGLGGTFDYVAGTKWSPPRFIRQIGLEWLYRLITQPYRAGRIKNATWDLVVALLRHKVFHSYPYRPNVSVTIINKDNKVFVGRKYPGVPANGQRDIERLKNYWQLPQGGIDEGEEVVEAAMREVEEETGLKDLRLIKVSEKRLAYDWRNAHRPLLFNKMKFRGQEQQFVYFRFHGSDEQIKLDSHELIDYKWIEPDELHNIIHSERMDATLVVQDELRLILG
jgi:N-acetylglucosaminyldiphosphoundecaprenol N-acetyl-beta-D-mannosaminyltransferase